MSADRRKLAERGLLVSDNVWGLTTAGESVVARPTPAIMSGFAKATAGLRGNALVAETYRRFPYYATRSQIAGSVLKGDVAALEQIECARPRQTHGLVTIGYEGLSLEAYLNRLLHAGVTVLCDVRKNPLSRKYGFSKKTLANGCQGVGLRYEHLPELGIASTERQSLKTQADYDSLFQRYESDTLPMQTSAVTTISGWIDAGETVALTCYERAPQQCHRHCVAEAVERAAPAISAHHL